MAEIKGYTMAVSPDSEIYIYGGESDKVGAKGEVERYNEVHSYNFESN